MKRMKLILAAVCAVALVAAFALVGCSSSSSSSAASSSAASSEASSSASASASSAAASGEAVELQIFAANSLTKAMAEAQELYTQQNPNVTFADTQYKSSGELNSMLEAGSYADIEITASKSTMDTAEEAGYIDPATRVTMFKNDLVIVTKADNADITEVTLDDVATGKYTVCVGDDSVPAGNYANQSLSTVGCFNDPDGKTGSESAGKANGTDAYAGTPLEGKVVTDTSVGNVCQHAASGDVDIAFVYTSDVERFAEKSPVKVVGTVPADTHKNITYPGAVTAQSKNAEAAAAFLDWCMTDKDVAEIWQKWGFELAA
ncbi:MAG: extracellular solute-binding protein [Eggerthellaceae bacterium]|nr:extracellular solute-binding protein [Eggerthellaceae bacterium]